MALELTAPYTVQKAVTSSTIEIIECIDSIKDGSVRALVNFVDSPEPFSMWITVWEGDAYNINWSQEDLEAEVLNILGGAGTSEV